MNKKEYSRLLSDEEIAEIQKEMEENDKVIIAIERMTEENRTEILYM